VHVHDPLRRQKGHIVNDLKVLTAVADMSIKFWTTGDSYGPFNNSLLLGRWSEETGRRNETFLSTKFEVKIDMAKRTMKVYGTPEYVKGACAASLERLQTGHIQLYIQHRVDPDTSIDKTMEVMAQLKAEGKSAFSVSQNAPLDHYATHVIRPITAAETEYSLFALEIEDAQTNILKTATELGVVIVPYSPLGRGFLTGVIKSRDNLNKKDLVHVMHPRFSKKNFGDNLKPTEQHEEIAKRKGRSSGQLCLVWILAQGDGMFNIFPGFLSLRVDTDSIPIPRTKHIKISPTNCRCCQRQSVKGRRKEDLRD
jgi:aryl-alcohol dehydrogenase-like predicted oxidoreductase